MKKIMIKAVGAILILLLAAGCSLPGLASTTKETVKIGTLGTSESEIMGNVLGLMIERETELDTDLVTHLGSSIVQHQGMMRGDLDITSTRYTGTDVSGALGMDPIIDPDKALATVKKEFPKQFNQTWEGTYGFENSYSVAIPRQYAEEHDIEKISDLEDYSDELRFGVDNAWINREGDGYDGFKETYFPFDEVYPMDIGLVYQAAASGHMDVVLAYSSDGRIEEFDLKVLEDDKRFFPPYDASPVVRNELLEKYPKIQDITDALEGTISTEDMQKLNYEADVNLKSPEHVAQKFLEEHDYFENQLKEGN